LSHTIFYLASPIVGATFVRKPHHFLISRTSLNTNAWPTFPRKPSGLIILPSIPRLSTHPTILHTSQSKMSFDMEWSPDFCLACDKQTDGNVYCSEACRLAEYEKASSNTGSTASSPVSPRGPLSWPATRTSNNGFYMEPAYNFSKAQPYGPTPPTRTSTVYQYSRPQSLPVAYSRTVLTPSSSQSSLFSMQSSASSTSSEPLQLSEESRKALRAYASSFDQSRYSRRQSTN